MLHNKKIQTQLIKLMIVFVIGAISEYLVISLLNTTPYAMIKVQGAIGLGMIGYLVYSSYIIWSLLNEPSNQNDVSK